MIARGRFLGRQAETVSVIQDQGRTPGDRSQAPLQVAPHLGLTSQENNGEAHGLKGLLDLGSCAQLEHSSHYHPSNTEHLFGGSEG